MKKNENSELLNLIVQGYLFQCLDDSRSGYLLEWLDRGNDHDRCDSTEVEGIALDNQNGPPARTDGLG